MTEIIWKAVNRPEVWKHWRDRLAGRMVETHEDAPQAGYYRYRTKRELPWLPVAIWYEAPHDPETDELVGDERLVARIGQRPTAPERIWLSCRPISYTAFKALEQNYALGIQSARDLKPTF